jgi:hypothetical protein
VILIWRLMTGVLRHRLPNRLNLMKYRLTTLNRHTRRRVIVVYRCHISFFSIHHWYLWISCKIRRLERQSKINCAIIKIYIKFEVKSVVIPTWKSLILVVVIVMR